MREDSRDYPAFTTLHWHDGGTCHGHSTPEACAANAIDHKWVGKVLERTDAYRDGTVVKCYSLIASGFDHYAKQGKYVTEVKLAAIPIAEER
jgi:hypothetical protein